MIQLKSLIKIVLCLKIERHATDDNVDDDHDDGVHNVQITTNRYKQKNWLFDKNGMIWNIRWGGFFSRGFFFHRGFLYCISIRNVRREVRSGFTEHKKEIVFFISKLSIIFTTFRDNSQFCNFFFLYSTTHTHAIMLSRLEILCIGVCVCGFKYTHV